MPPCPGNGKVILIIENGCCGNLNKHYAPIKDEIGDKRKKQSEEQIGKKRKTVRR